MRPNLDVGDWSPSACFAPSVLSSSISLSSSSASSENWITAPRSSVRNRPAANSRAKPSGSAAAASFMRSNDFKSRRLCCFCICNIDMAERSAMASGFSLSEIGTGGGSGLKTAGVAGGRGG